MNITFVHHLFLMVGYIIGVTVGYLLGRARRES